MKIGRLFITTIYVRNTGEKNIPSNSHHLYQLWIPLYSKPISDDMHSQLDIEFQLIILKQFTLSHFNSLKKTIVLLWFESKAGRY